jgi:transcriptional regulator with XRE-family HTH domain
LPAPGPDSEHLASLGRAVSELRVRQGVSVPQLAACLGIEPESVSALEHGRLDPAYELLLDLAECLKIDAAELFARAEGGRAKRQSRSPDAKWS